MAKIFICYRRDDSPYAAHLIHEALLKADVPKEEVFFDVRSLLSGERWTKELERELRQSSVLVAIIGDKWLAAKGPDNRRRIDNPEDPVRKEIKTALRIGLVTIPVLVDHAEPLSRSDLPDVS